tara:strand:+ start:23673 stop:23963 length:291 start_codon:yes stop_codon:yes gene_type:complete
MQLSFQRHPLITSNTQFAELIDFKESLEGTTKVAASRYIGTGVTGDEFDQLENFVRQSSIGSYRSGPLSQPVNQSGHKRRRVSEMTHFVGRTGDIT